MSLKKLYMAKCMKELESQTELNQNIKNRATYLLIFSAEKVFRAAEEKYLDKDEEAAYVQYMRFVEFVLLLRQRSDFKRGPVYNRLLQNANIATMKAESLKGSLTKRYSILEEAVAKENEYFTVIEKGQSYGNMSDREKIKDIEYPNFDESVNSEVEIFHEKNFSDMLLDKKYVSWDSPPSTNIRFKVVSLSTFDRKSKPSNTSNKLPSARVKLNKTFSASANNRKNYDSIPNKKFPPSVKRKSKNAILNSITDETDFSSSANDSVLISFNKEQSLAKEILDIPNQKLRKEEEFEKLCSRKELEAEEDADLKALKEKTSKITKLYGELVDVLPTLGVAATTEFRHCRRNLNPDNLRSHKMKCEHRPVICPDCLETVPLQKFLDEDHVRQKVNARGCACMSPHPVPLHVNKMAQDFKELFLSQEECDVTINVQGQEFPAHKAVLRARSPVLAAAFRHDMKERAAKAIDIKDCDPSSFSDFLSFLYYGNVDSVTTENVFSLFTTADKYDVQDLRSHCLAFMKENLSVDTFVDTIAVALQHGEKDLLALATDFFAKNQLDIIETVKWQSFLVENPIQSNEIVIKALKSSKKKHNVFFY